MNAVPVIVMFCAAAPAFRLDGEIELIAGIEVFCCPEPDDGPVEHPVKMVKENARARKRTEARIRRKRGSLITRADP